MPAGIVLLALGVALLDLSTGAYPTSFRATLAALGGEGGEPLRLVVLEWRLPRVAAALLFGAALGIGGAIFQSLARNPLGSPDVVGVDAGAFAGMLLVTLSMGLSGDGIVIGAFLGGALAAGTTYLLAGGASGLRFILTGVGLAMMLTAVNSWVVSSARLEVATAATAWASGTLDGVQPDQLLVAGLVLVPLMLLAMAMQRHLRALELGDEIATALGVPVGGARAMLLVLGGALTIIVTACAGPIGFVALSAPQLARLLAGTAGLPFPASAAMGSLLLVGADLVATNLFAPARLPVGRVTLVCGGAYLAWLLLRDAARTGRP